MKPYILVLLAGALLCPAMMAQVTNATAGAKERQPLATDSGLRDKLVGVWSLSVTNPIRGNVNGQWMSTETTYRRDGTFEMKGAVGTMVPDDVTRKTKVIRDGKLVPLESSSSPANGSGVWRIDHGNLCSTFTNGNWQTNVETCFEIQSLTDTEFTYRRKSGGEMGLVLKEIRKR